MKRVKDVDGRLVVDWSSVLLTEQNLQSALLLKNILTLYRDSYLKAHPIICDLLGDYSVEIVVNVKI